MGRMINWDKIPDTDDLPKGKYDFEVKKFEVKGDDDDETQKLRYQLDAVVISEGPFKNSHHFQTYWIGTDDDPKAEADDLWNGRAVRDMKKLFVACGGPFGSDIDVNVASCVGCKFTGEITTYTKPETGKTYTNLRNVVKIGGAAGKPAPANPFAS